jgi:hypothetical protein
MLAFLDILSCINFFVFFNFIEKNNIKVSQQEVLNVSFSF